jgi:adenosylhomocysteine nucleosidase
MHFRPRRRFFAQTLTLTVLVFAWLGARAGASETAPPPAAPPLPPAPLFAVLTAYPSETNAMIAEFGLNEGTFTEQRVKGFRYRRGVVEGKDVVVFETGMSLVNAAMALQLALERLPITHVLFAGVAGGIDPSLRIGDVVIPENWAYHSEAGYFNPAPDGKGWVVASYFRKRYPNFGMIFPDDMQAIRADKEAFEYVATFPSDPRLLEAARRAVARLGPILDAHSGRAIDVSVGGIGVSGTVFMDNREYREFVFNTWRARCLDMESTAYAHVCYTNEIPFLAVRALSDLAGGQAPGEKNHADDTQEVTSAHAVKVLRAILREL